MARSDYKVWDNQYRHFLTFTAVDWLPLFSPSGIITILIDSLIFMQQKNRLSIYGYVIMPDHMHLIAFSSNLSKEIQNYKSFTSKKIIEKLKEHNNDDILYNLSEAKAPYN